MNQYLSSASLKAIARGQLIGNYGTVTGACVLHFLCTFPLAFLISFFVGTQTITRLVIFLTASFLINLISGFFVAGETYLYLKLACNQPALISDLFFGFRNNQKKILALSAVMSVISVIYSLVASVAGYFVDFQNPDPVTVLLYVIFYVLFLAVYIFINLLLSQSYYLLLDYPDLSTSMLLRKSMQLMKGSIGRLFYISISFIPFVLLGFLSCGIGYLWVKPYILATKTNFYLDLIKKASIKKESSI